MRSILYSNRGYNIAASGQANMFDTVSFESYLSRRFKRSMGDNSSVFYEMTHDVAQIHQYFLLLSNMFINLCSAFMPSIPRYEPDDRNVFVVARKGRQCLGGCRVTFREPEDRSLLPLEEEGELLSSLFRHLPVSSVRSAEVSNIAVFPDEAKSLVGGLMQEVLAVLVERKVRFAFINAPLNDIRAYKETTEACGFITSVVSHQAYSQFPLDSEVKHWLMVIDLSPAYKKNINIDQHVNSEESVI